MIEEVVRDLRLVSVWHGSTDPATLHFSLFNNGPDPLTDFTLCITGTLWLRDRSNIQGGTVVRTQSNFVEIRPDIQTLETGGMWTFSLGALNTWPRHAHDGPLSAYVVRGGTQFSHVAVQPLARSHDSADLVGAIRQRPDPAPVITSSLVTISVIPFPNVASVAVAPLPTDLPILQPDPEMTPEHLHLCDSVAALTKRVTPGAHHIFARPGEEGHRRLVMTEVIDPRLGKEGYKIAVEDSAIVLHAASTSGFFYGLVTLAQMAVGALDAPQKFGFPLRGTITDVPRFGWRGILVDTARTLYSLDELKRLADLFAWLKLNVMHLHLNDDEGWRIGVDGYPQVAEIAAWRGHGHPVPPLLGSSFSPYGGVYSPDDMAELQSHAGLLGLTVMPEIDVPGHAHALLEAIPSLRETGDTGGYNSIQGFFGNALNPCLPGTYDFLGAAFGTVTKHFAGPYVHIGGDEVGAATWSKSPAAVKAAAERGLASTVELQSDILEAAARQLIDNGRSIVAWEDALSHGRLDPAKTIAMAWQHPDRAVAHAEKGYRVVLAPGNAYYLDMAPSGDWGATGGHWAGVVPLSQTYDFEPDLNWPDEMASRLAGVHACIWGEYMNDRRNFDALVFPRIFAFAERAWIERSAKDFAGFLVRAGASTARIDWRKQDRA